MGEVFEEHLLCIVEDSGRADIRLYSFTDKNFKEVIRADLSVESFDGNEDELYIIMNLTVNPERLYLTGGSYAGFQVANIISRDHRFKAACAQRGVFNLTTFWSTTDIPIWGLWEMETTPWVNLDLMWELSPVARVKEINTPLLIIHSENDYRVSVSQAEELFASLRLDNKEAELVRYPRDGHELSRSGEPIHVVDRIERMIDWFDKH